MKLSNELKTKIKKQSNLALVTGASSGMGKEIAKLLAQAKVDLLLCSRNENELNRLAAELRGIYKIDLQVLPFDLSIKQQVLDLLSVTEERKIDTLIHAAGYGTSGFFKENDIERELNMVELNIYSTTLLSYEFANRFTNLKKGNIILFSSLLAFQGAPLCTNYAATKAYVQSFAEGLAKELKPNNVKVLVAAPGPTKTGFAERASMIMDMTADATEVAYDIIKRIGTSGTVVPGKLSRFLLYAMALLPRSMKVSTIHTIMKKMAKKTPNETFVS